MIGRLFASVLWVAILLIPPLRYGAELVANFFWPLKLLGSDLGGTAIPLMVMLFAGYPLTSFVFEKAWKYVASEWRMPAFTKGNIGFDPSARLGLIVTGCWFVTALLLRQMTLHTGLAGVLIGIGIVPRLPWEKAPAPAPSPLPEPIPSPPHPLPVPGPDEDWAEDSETEDTYNRIFRWLFNEKPFLKTGPEHSLAATMSIRKSAYEEFRKKDHTVRAHADYVKFADAELDDDVVTNAAAKLRTIVNEEKFDRLTEIHLAMAFTLSLRYASDDQEDGREYPKFPVETLVDKRGDCEDHAILCGAILHRLGHRVALILLPKHAALAVEAPIPIDGATIYVPESGTHMFYCEVTPAETTTRETTAVQWWLGMDPGTAKVEGVYLIGKS